MTTIEILKKARELISDPAHWMKGGSNANHVKEATAFCAWHAICKANAPDYSEKLDTSTILFAFNFSRLISLFGWNDAPERTHAEVLQRFDEAIARLDTANERKTIWLCGACGRTGATRETVGDESCYLHSVEVFSDSIKCNLNGRIKYAQAVARVHIERRESAS